MAAAMRWAGVAFRAHDPRWSWAPLSGDGAAAKGGRFNAIGVPALYLALSVEGMLVEMGHGFGHRFEPLTICSYTVDMDDVVDLRDEDGRAAAGVTLGELGSSWAYERSSGREPASVVVAARLIALGAAGILVPSFARGARRDMHNLVCWRWAAELPHKVAVHDPAARLPVDQSSWPRR